jgi:hypothetical protein
MSLRASTVFPDPCSGDMYPMVPAMMPGCVGAIRVDVSSPSR